MNKKVLLGMSGGVDSSVAAIVLKEQGYEVYGATMKNWEDDSTEKAIEDAKRVADLLNIKHYVFDFTKEFKNYVIDEFGKRYIEGNTPNPCVICNKYLKFGLLLDKAKELGMDYIATGHYANVEYNPKKDEYYLKKATSNKDQTYVLYNFTQDILKHVIFPLGKFKNKEEIRQIAKQNGLDVHSKSDSQEICFIPDNDYKKFLKENFKNLPKSGNIVDTKGNILGKHEGIINYTIGQRKGLGITYKEPLYVVKINKDKNEVVIGTNEELYSKYIEAKDVNYILEEPLDEIEVEVKIRYSSVPTKALLKLLPNKKAKITLCENQRAITPGQAVVFYNGDIVLRGRYDNIITKEERRI